MDWYTFVRKYVWDDTRTPYFTSAARLSRSQAHKELFFYVSLLAMLFVMVFVGAFIDLMHNFHFTSLGWFVYALVVLGAAVWLGLRKSLRAALLCASAPLAVLVHFAFNGFHPNLGALDKLLLLGFVILWLRYAWRTLAIAKVYTNLPSNAKA